MIRPSAAQMPRVFVSYRRDDTAQTAAALALLLSSHLSSEVVFLDHRDIEWGGKWLDQLNNAIVDRDVVICLIGSKWEGNPLSSAEKDRRIDRSDDPVRMEITRAIECGVQLMPVSVDRPDVPIGLPADLEPLLAEEFTSLRATDYETDFAVILARLWRLQLEHVDGAQVVLRVGSRNVTANDFVKTIRKDYSPEVRFVSLAVTQRMELTMIDVRERAPHLYVFLADDADDRDRRVLAAVARSWDKITVVAVSAPAGFTAASLAVDPAWSWLANALGDAGGAVEVASDSSIALPSLSGTPRPRGIHRIREVVAARPRAALLVGGLAAGGGAAIAVAASQTDQQATMPTTTTTIDVGLWDATILEDVWEVGPFDTTVSYHEGPDGLMPPAVIQPASIEGGLWTLEQIEPCNSFECRFSLTEGPAFLVDAELSVRTYVDGITADAEGALGPGTSGADYEEADGLLRWAGYLDEQCAVLPPPNPATSIWLKRALSVDVGIVITEADMIEIQIGYYERLGRDDPAGQRFEVLDYPSDGRCPQEIVATATATRAN